MKMETGEEFYRRYRDKLFGYLMRMTGDYHLASNLLQESFTRWKRIPLKPTGSSGYWEVSLTIPEGEHRFTYILLGQQRISDPRVPTREKDDFGGENSILYGQVGKEGKAERKHY